MTTAHIVAIRQNGQIAGHQLRRSTGGPGLTTYFASSTHGDADRALRAAKQAAKSEGLTLGRRRGGSAQGRTTRLSPTSAAGIRWRWVRYGDSAALVVVASWQHKGKPRCTSYSTERHGLEGALDLAIAARVSAGAPAPDRRALLRELRAAKRAGNT